MTDERIFNEAVASARIGETAVAARLTAYNPGGEFERNLHTVWARVGVDFYFTAPMQFFTEAACALTRARACGLAGQGLVARSTERPAGVAFAARRALTARRTTSRRAPAPRPASARYSA